MSLTRPLRWLLVLLVSASAVAGLGVASAKASERSCIEEFLASISPLSSEHPPNQPAVNTKVVAPFVVRAYAKVPLLGGHHRYYSRTYLAFFGSLHERGATDVYML